MVAESGGLTFMSPLSGLERRLLLEDDCLMQAYLAGEKHFEVETYSYWLLPGPKLQVTDSIIAELEWLIKKLDHIGKGVL
jgi:hypothetical protein